MQGTSMGSTFAPSLVCLYMACFEEQHIFTHINPFNTDILKWRRYIDNILVFWKGDNTTCQGFGWWISTLNPYLRFTQSASTRQIPFQDLLISINQGQLRTKTYKNTTDCNSLLLFESQHPKALWENLPYGQFLCVRRNCSFLKDYGAQAKTLSRNLSSWYYASRVTKRAEKSTQNN